MRRLLFATYLVAAVAMFDLSAAADAGDLDKFFPKETDMVVSVNVRQLLDSPIGKKHAVTLINELLAKDKEARDTIKALGLDPLTDFQRISMGVGLEDVGNPKAVTVINGRFDLRKIGDLMDQLAKSEPQKFAIEKVSGKTIYKVNRPGSPAMYVAPLDATIIVAGTEKEFIGSAFDVVNGTRKSEIKKELAELIAKADYKSSVNLVAYTKNRLDSIPLPDPNMKKVISQIQACTVDLRVETDIQLEITMETANADDAKKMKDLVGGGLELAKVQIKIASSQQPSFQPLVDMVNTLSVGQREKMVLITGKLTGDGLDKLLKKDK